MEEKQTQQRTRISPWQTLAKFRKNLPPDAFIVREAESRAAELMRQKGFFFSRSKLSTQKKVPGEKNANEQSCKFGKLQVKF